MLTKDLALRLEKSEFDHLLSWATLPQAVDQNVFGVEVRSYCCAAGFTSRDSMLGPLFNRVLGFCEADLKNLPQIVDFYAERGLTCRVDVNPYQATAKTMDALAKSGLRPARFHSFLYAQRQHIEARPPSTGPEDVAIKPIALDNAPQWAEVWKQGFGDALGASPAAIPRLSAETARLCGQPDWDLYMATVRETPAAVAAIYIQDGIASLVLAGTLPSFRQRGCQKALLQARISRAVARDCDVIVAQAALGSTSQNNMERAGLSIAYTRAYWCMPAP